MRDLPSRFLSDLRAIFPPERVATSEAIRRQHARDQSAHAAHAPQVVLWPLHVGEVSAALRLANQAGVAVTAWGAGTSLEGNPIALHGGVMLDFQQMNRVIALHAQDFQVTVEPGILYKDMNKALARAGLFFAPDPGANASIGGMLANNAAGIRTVKYGATRDNVLALEVVLASGEVIRTGSRSVKQSAGYDLTHLFVGSEGTLGVITQATLKLAPIPAHFSAALAAFPTVEAAAQSVCEIIGAGLEPTALELLDTTAVIILNTEHMGWAETPTLFMEFTGPSEPALQETLALAQEICLGQGYLSFQAGLGREQRNRIWESRHRLFEIQQRYYPGQLYVIADVSAPISHYPALIHTANELMAKLQLTGSLFGHAGDGNLHAVIFYPADDANAAARTRQFNEQIVERALALDGTITGEHGVGIGKQKFMAQEHGEAALAVMRQIKHTLDPKGILNPGKVLG